MTKHTQHSETSAAMPFSWIPGFKIPAVNGPVMEMFGRANEACNKACFAWQEEIARFVTARLQSDTQLAQKLMTSRNWADAAKLQQEWAAALAQDYLDEANRLVQLSSRVAADLMVPPRPEERPASRLHETHHQAAE